MSFADAPFLKEAAADYARANNGWQKLVFPTCVRADDVGRVCVSVIAPEPARPTMFFELVEELRTTYPLLGTSPRKAESSFKLEPWEDVTVSSRFRLLDKRRLPCDVDDLLGIVGVTWIFGMPGVGKTTLAHQVPAIIDADYGNWRRRCGKSRAELVIGTYTQQLISFMEDVARRVAGSALCLEDGHALILCNEIDIIPFAKALGHEVIVAAPTEEAIPQWIEGMRRRRRSIIDRGGVVNDDFYQRAEVRGLAWAKSWKKAAKAMAVPFVETRPWLDESVFLSCRRGQRTAPGLYRAAAEACAALRARGLV